MCARVTQEGRRRFFLVCLELNLLAKSFCVSSGILFFRAHENERPNANLFEVG